VAKPWGRIELDYINHDKFKAINANAICLWHEGKNYCDLRLTDGLIPTATAKHFRFHSKKAIEMLTTSCGPKPGADQPYAPLWEVVSGFGWKMHDYLEHNDCRDEVQERLARYEEERARKKANQKAWRERQKFERRANWPTVTDNVTGYAAVTEPVTGEQRSSPLPGKHQHQHLQISPTERGRGQPPMHIPGLSGRFKVWRWMVDEWVKRLGDQAESFNVEAWLLDLDQRDKLLIPVNTNWKWLDAQWWDEATKRGLVAQAAVVGGEDAMWAAAIRKGPSVRP
jgi:hypothetical protein